MQYVTRKKTTAIIIKLNTNRSDIIFQFDRNDKTKQMKGGNMKV